MSNLLDRHARAAELLPTARSIIGGAAWIGAATGVYPHVNPSTGAVQSEVPLSGSDAVDAAVAAARAAYPAWRDTAPEERRAILERLAALMIEETDWFGTVSTLENGITADFGKGNFVPLAARWTRYYAGWADKLEGLCLNTTLDEPLVYTIPEPFGVVAIIITWNAPLLSLAMKIPAALAAGNCVVLKPAEFTPYTSMKFVELAHKAGVPEGVLNLIIGGNDAAAELTRHKGVNKISFTGGPLTATKIMQAAAENLVPVLFELGGKGANLLFEDANLAQAIPFSAMFSLVNTGQGCALPTRLLVQRSVHAQVVEGVKACLAHQQPGDPMLHGTFMGPLVNAAAMDRVTAIIDKAKAEKAGDLIAGGNRGSGELSHGYFLEPTVFDNVDPQSSLALNEVFGPVLSIIPFDTEEEAVAIANGTEYGLTNYVQTSDMRRARRLARVLHSGTIGINGTGNMHVGAPFGGVGISGFGREGGLEGIKEFVSTKTVLMG